MSYDPGAVNPNLVCPICGHTNTIRVLGGAITCQSCHFLGGPTTLPGHPHWDGPLQIVPQPTSQLPYPANVVEETATGIIPPWRTLGNPGYQ